MPERGLWIDWHGVSPIASAAVATAVNRPVRRSVLVP